MFTRFKYAALAAFALTLFTFASTPTRALADDEQLIPGEFSGNVALVSDYSFRGISQTQTDVAFQGGLDWAHDSGVYLGLWGSTIKFPEDDSFLEQDIYGGFANEVGAFSYDVGAVFFWYPKEEALNYWEFAFNGAYDFDVAAVSAGFLWSPDYFGVLGDGYYLSTGVSVPLPVTDRLDVSIDANLGYTIMDKNLYEMEVDEVVVDAVDDYLDWNVGLTVGFPSGIGVDLRYVDTDISKGLGGDDTEARFVAGLSYSF